jgi:hypothetical protein
MMLVGIGWGVPFRNLMLSGALIVTDPGVTAINAQGWDVTFTSPPAMDPVGAPRYVVAARQGFDATGNATSYSENIVLTQRIRQAYPNQGLLDASRVSLSSYIYSTDTIVGVTNNATEISPVPVAAWGAVDRRMVGNTFAKEWAEVIPFHRNARGGKQVACVVWTWSDGTNTVTATSSTPVISGASTDLNPVICYRPAADVNITSLTAGQITMNAKVYPWIGGAASVLDSATGTADSREFCPQVFTKNVAKAASPPFAYVAATGNDGTGVVDTVAATAAAAPFLTITGALQGLRAATAFTGNKTDGCIIRFQEGTYVLATNPTFATYQDFAEVIWEPAPGAAKANTIIQYGATAAYASLQKFIRMRGLSLVKQASFSINGVAGGKLVIENCNVDGGALNTPLFGSSHFTSHAIGMTLTNAGVSSLTGTSDTIEWRLKRGVDAGTVNLGASSLNVDSYCNIGCTYRGVSLFNSTTKSQSKSILAFSKCMGLGKTSAVLAFGGQLDVNGAAIVQNVIEWSTVDSQPAFRPSGDSDLGNITHFIMHQNTFAGFNNLGRWNALYNETAGGARTHKLCSFKGNISVQINTKHDVFLLDGTRTQSWAYLYGVDCAGEFSQFLDAGAGAFAQAYPGLKAKIGTSATVAQNPSFTTPAHCTTGPAAGAGNGNYALQAGSLAIGQVVDPVLAFDLAGTARNANNNAAGAYERAA